MGFFDMFKKKAKQEIGQAVQKVEETSKDKLVDGAADALKKVTPDSVDKMIDQAADRIETKVQ